MIRLRNVTVMVFLLCFLFFAIQVSGNESVYAENSSISNGTDDQLLRDRFVAGILKSRSVESKNGERKPYWLECGKKIKEEDRKNRAIEWANAYIDAFDKLEKETDTNLDTLKWKWGMFATSARESGFNVCTLDKESRYWAYQNGLVNKFVLTYPKEVVWEIISSKKWKMRSGAKADLGPFQQRFSKITKKEFDDLLSLDPGIYLGIKEMYNRAIWHKTKYNKTELMAKPWLLWSTWNTRSLRSLRYDQYIVRLAKWLGATPDEI